ncbi:MAG: hypothetical protein DMG10_12900 [Acidobacteria bacterium]|nr:MAG: hypothetical protein DMG10_12900 [Acidobacteriota bacterium]
MSLVICHWSFVIGHLSLVICHWSLFVISHFFIVPFPSREGWSSAFRLHRSSRLKPELRTRDDSGRAASENEK